MVQHRISRTRHRILRYSIRDVEVSRTQYADKWYNDSPSEVRMGCFVWYVLTATFSNSPLSECFFFLDYTSLSVNCWSYEVNRLYSLLMCYCTFCVALLYYCIHAFSLIIMTFTAHLFCIFRSSDGKRYSRSIEINPNKNDIYSSSSVTMVTSSFIISVLHAFISFSVFEHLMIL